MPHRLFVGAFHPFTTKKIILHFSKMNKWQGDNWCSRWDVGLLSLLLQRAHETQRQVETAVHTVVFWLSVWALSCRCRVKRST